MSIGEPKPHILSLFEQGLAIEKISEIVQISSYWVTSSLVDEFGKSEFNALKRAYQDRALLDMIEQGCSDAQIVRKLGLRAKRIHNVRTWVERRGKDSMQEEIVKLKANLRMTRASLRDRNLEIMRLYLDEGRTTREIGQELGLSGQRVSQILQGMNITKRNKQEAINQRIYELCVGGKTYREICAELGLSRSQIAARIKRNGFPTPRYAVPYPSKKRPAPHRDRIVSLYLDGLTGSEVAEKLGIPLPTVYANLRAANVPRRRKNSSPYPCTDRVAERQREVWRLHKTGMRHGAIATSLGVPYHIVANDIRHIRIALRDREPRPVGA